MTQEGWKECATREEAKKSLESHVAEIPVGERKLYECGISVISGSKFLAYCRLKRN